MLSNVEIKARVDDPVRFLQRAAELSQSEGTVIRQQDTFYPCSRGRLKLRDLMDGSGQLIFYDRPDTDGPKLSRFSISGTSDPAGLQAVLSSALGVKGRVQNLVQAVLSSALGVKGRVQKERRLFLIGQTRIHLDQVEGLGTFMELEVQMQPQQTLEDGQKVAEDLMEQLGVSRDSLVTGAYMDLILEGQK